MIPVSDTVMVALITGFTTLFTALITGGTVVAANVVLYLMAERNRTIAHAQTMEQGTRAAAAIHENTVLTQIGVENAQGAQNEANHANLKIQAVQDALSASLGLPIVPVTATSLALAARLADTEKRAG